VFTARFSGPRDRRGGRNALETELHRLGVQQKNGKPNHPQTQGKVGRFQQTMKKWLTAQQPQPATITQLQALLDTFTSAYNQQRPHRSLPRRATPAAAYAARPRATPASPLIFMTGSAPTPSAPAAPSPCAPAAASTTSASAAPTPAPAS
jgi:hypothetical protein